MISNKIIQFRKQKIGGSDIAPILGKGKFSGAASVAQRIKGSEAAQLYNPAFEFGNRWECQVAQLFAENHPEFLVLSLQEAYKNGILEKLNGFKARAIELSDGSVTLLDAENDWLVLNPDYILISRIGLGWGVLEIKTASEYAADDFGKTGTSEFPAHYIDQPKLYAHCMGASIVRGAVLIGQRDYREYNINPYAMEEASEVLGFVGDWYERHIVNNEPVAPSFVEASSLTIKHNALEASAELIEKIRIYKGLNDEMDKLKKAIKPIEEEIRAASAEYTEVTHLGEVIFTNNEKETLTFDSEMLARFEPDTYAKYLTKTTSKRFAKAKGFKNLGKITAIAVGEN